MTSGSARIAAIGSRSCPRPERRPSNIEAALAVSPPSAQRNAAPQALTATRDAVIQLSVPAIAAFGVVRLLARAGELEARVVVDRDLGVIGMTLRQQAVLARP